MARPQLSVGIIFKNEARCLERCLKSFQPLKEAVPCEIVMADTGSTDGSREIAAKYADILFDFPWINDFSAARNAVMDRCSGKWYLSVDADEWLNEDISELADFLRSLKKRTERVGTITVRNYQTEHFDAKRSNDLTALRMVRMSSGLRYVGPIHEYIPVAADREPLISFHKTILHHDGYVDWGGKRGQEKRRRNIELLRQEAERVPNDVRTLVHFTDSGHGEEDFLDRVYQMVQALKDRGPSWEAYGPPALRQAVLTADAQNLPELQEWLAMAEELFPRSFFVCLDIGYAMAHRCWKQGEYTECLRWCERYAGAMEDFRAGRGEMSGLLFSTLQFATESAEREMQNLRLRALCRCGRTAEADEILDRAACPDMDSSQFTSHMRILIELRAEGPILRLYERFSAPEYPEKRAAEHRSIFLQEAAAVFAPAYREKEEAEEGFTRHAYTLFASLRGKCEIGAAAVMMEAESMQEMEQLLGTIQDWDYLPIAALEYALEKGAQFPPAETRFSLEAMDKLAGRLGQNAPLAIGLTLRAAKSPPEDMPGLLWARGVAIVAVQACPWLDAEQGMALSRAFAEIVERFARRYYAGEALREENLCMLPGMYRAGCCCRRAFEALDGGDCGAYVRLLREGVTAYPGTKKMAAFLLDNTPEVQKLLAPPPEIQALVDQVRAVMARYEPNDPAVVALKQSEAYQKAAHWIEGSSRVPNSSDDLQIFTFWEPQSSIPPYIQLCMQTWKKILPAAKIHVLDYSNMNDYIDVKRIYGSQLFSGSFTLPMIADAVRALVLEQYGGIWMDADTILTGGGIKTYLHSSKDASFFGEPAKPSVHLAYIYGKKHAAFLQYWVSQCIQKIRALTKADMGKRDFWSYLGNSIVDPYLRAHHSEVEIVDVMKAECTPERKASEQSPFEAYIEFYFKRNLHLQDICSPLLLLHNSWTPPQYKMLSLEQLRRYDCTMSNILLELTQ